jgi:hypothetical protein
MTRPLSVAVASALSLLLGACASGLQAPSMPAAPATAAGHAPTTEISHDLSARQRIDDHAVRLGDGIARFREVKGDRMPQTLRELALTLAADGRPCFTEILKDHWFQPYAYSPRDERAGRFQLTSAGPNGQFGDGDDLSASGQSGDPRIETYGFTFHPGE